MGQYTTPSGDTYNIDYDQAKTPEDATYWAYYITASDSQGHKKTYRVLIEKEYIPVEQQAEMFLSGDPLTQVKSLLNDYGVINVPMVFHQLPKMWTII